MTHTENEIALAIEMLKKRVEGGDALNAEESNGSFMRAIATSLLDKLKELIGGDASVEWNRVDIETAYDLYLMRQDRGVKLASSMVSPNP